MAMSIMPGLLALVLAAAVAGAAGAGASSSGAIEMDLILFSNATARQATCNDGTPSGYYLWRPAVPSSKWIVYLEGGGLCYDFESCRTREELLISSKDWPKTLSAGGMFTNTTDNKFAEYNKIVVIYCTSDLYSGTATAKRFGTLKWDFHGANIVPAVLEDFKSELANATEFLLTGGSAGGVGTLMNYEVARAALPHVTVRALADAGWFLLDVEPFAKNVPLLPDMMQKGIALWEGSVPSTCAVALGKDQFRCYSGPVVYPYLPDKASIMILKSQTDTWTVEHDGVKKPLTAAEILWLTQLGASVRQTFDADQVTNVFSANCLYHTCLQIMYETLEVNNVTLHQAVEQWYFGTSPVRYIDSCTEPMCNTSCMKKQVRRV